MEKVQLYMAEADTNRDGKISKEEMAVWLAKQHEIEEQENEGYGQDNGQPDGEEVA
jgi:hypothetical protein